MSLLIAAALTLISAPLLLVAIRFLKRFCQTPAEEAALWRSGVFLSVLPLPLALIADFWPRLSLDIFAAPSIPITPINTPVTIPIEAEAAAPTLEVTTTVPLLVLEDLAVPAQTTDWSGALAGLAIAVLVAGVIFATLRLVWGHITLRRLLTSCKPLRDETAKAHLKTAYARHRVAPEPKLAHLNADLSPFVAGLGRPTLVLTDTVLKLDRTAFDFVCGHELAHIRRKDTHWRLGEDIVGCILWFNPFVRRLRSEAYEACERACDADVLNWAPRKAYARTLLTLFRSGRVPDAALAFPPNQKRSAEMRLKSILSHDRDLNRPGGSRLMTCLIAGVAAPVIVLQAFAASMAAETVDASNPVVLLSGGPEHKASDQGKEAHELFGGDLSSVDEARLADEQAEIEREWEALEAELASLEEEADRIEAEIEDTLSEREYEFELQELQLEEQLEQIEQQLEDRLIAETSGLEDRAAQLEAEYEAMEARHENGELSDEEFRVQARAMEAQYHALEREQDRIERTLERELVARERELERTERNIERQQAALEHQLERQLRQQERQLEARERALERRLEHLEARQERLEDVAEAYREAARERGRAQPLAAPRRPELETRRVWPTVSTPPAPRAIPIAGKSAEELLPHLNHAPITHPVIIHERVRLTSPFGMRPWQGKKRMHNGTDLAAPMGTPVLVAGNGVVLKITTTDSTPGYGNTVLVDHGDGIQTLYANLDTSVVSVGDTLKAGAQVGTLGNSGVGSTGPHLHFELRLRLEQTYSEMDEAGNTKEGKHSISKYLAPEDFDGFELYRRII